MSHLLRDLKVHYRVYTSLTLNSYLNQTNLLHSVTNYFFKIHLILVIFCLKFSNKNVARSCHFCMRATCLAHLALPCFDQARNIPLSHYNGDVCYRHEFECLTLGLFSCRLSL